MNFMQAIFSTVPLVSVCQIKPEKNEVKALLADNLEVTFLPMEDLSAEIKYFLPVKKNTISSIYSAYTYFADGDVLLAKITPCFENGKVGIAKNLINGIGFGSSEYIVFRPYDKLNQEFLYYFLSRASFRETGRKQMSGAVGHKRVSKEFIGNLQIPLPPITEQTRIVTILDEAFTALDQAKANLERNLQNAKELFQSELNRVFTEQGEGWVERKLGEVCEKITKGSSPKWQGINYVESPGVLFITSENVGEYSLLIEKKKYVEEKFNQKDKKSILNHGDVLTNIVGASIGRTAIYSLEEAANINQAVCMIRCKKSVLSNEYLMYLLNSPFLKKRLHDGEINNARANLSLTFFSNLSINLSSVKHQEDVVKSLKHLKYSMDQVESSYKDRLAHLTTLKQSLLEQAFAGKL
jgi:type I restriction enzyme, S subunit